MYYIRSLYVTYCIGLYKVILEPFLTRDTRYFFSKHEAQVFSIMVIFSVALFLL